MAIDPGLEIDGRHLLLDFDGTIVVTEVLARRAITATFLERRIEVPDDFPQMIVGRTWESAVREMVVTAHASGIRLPPEAELRQDFQGRYHQLFSEGVPLVPGFQERLPELKRRAAFIGIVTGSEHHEVRAILEQWGFLESFDRIWAAGDYAQSKPHPAPYLTALRDLSLEPHQAIIFEDSRAGMESAHRAGVGFVQVSHEEHCPDPDPRALCTIRDWRELRLQSNS